MNNILVQVFTSYSLKNYWKITSTLIQAEFDIFIASTSQERDSTIEHSFYSPLILFFWVKLNCNISRK